MGLFDFLKSGNTAPTYGQKNNNYTTLICRACSDKVTPGSRHLCKNGSGFLAPANPTKDTDQYVLTYSILKALGQEHRG